MSRITISPLRTEGNTLFKFVTGLGQNGLQTFTVRNKNGKIRDVTGLDLRFVVKTEASASDTELDSDFPLTPTIVDGPKGQISVDMATINFANVLDRVLVVLGEVVSAVVIPISQDDAFIGEAGIAVP